MRLPFCPACVPTRSPDVPEGVVGRLMPEGVVGRFVPVAAASPIPVRELVEFFCLGVAAEPDGVARPLPPLLVLDAAAPPLAAVCRGEVPAVCLGEADVLEAAVVRLALLTGVVGIDVRPL